MTLSSDLGAAYSAQMKAVLFRSIDPGRVVELTHELSAHDVREAAFVVRAMAVGFPAGTVHVAVVDPGVGGPRVPIAIACRDGSVLVGPDNGVLSPLAAALGGPRGYRILGSRLRARPRVGTTFDGRDLFAPAAARIAQGVLPSRLGPRHAPVRLRLAQPKREREGGVGAIVHVDHFGNLITNIPAAWIAGPTRRVRLRIGIRSLTVPWVTSYQRLGRGRTGALGSSFGTVEVAVDRGRAARRFAVGAGTSVAVRREPALPRARQSVNSERSKRH